MSGPPAPSERTLVVMRHAQAGTAATSDQRRPLTEDGVEQAAAAGRWLAERGVVPGRALVSAALRTEQTWQHVARAAGWSLEVDTDDSLYTATDTSALDLVRTVDDGVDTVLLLGHNPTMHSLALLLDDGDGDRAAGLAVTRGFAPASLAVYTVPGPWADLAPGSARLTALRPS